MAKRQLHPASEPLAIPRRLCSQVIFFPPPQPRKICTPPANSDAQVGGIQVAFAGSQTDLIVNGGLEDPRTGYSATMGFMQLPIGSISELSHYAAAGVMTGAADPMMHFPAGTVFTPYLVARNLAQQVITVRPTVYWMQAGTPRSYVGPPREIAPQITQKLDVSGLLTAAGLANFNGSVNFEFDITGPAHGFLLTTGSVDQKNTYVFSVSVSAVKESIAKELSHWTTANGNDTMVTVWNPSDEAQDLAFNVFTPPVNTCCRFILTQRQLVPSISQKSSRAACLTSMEVSFQSLSKMAAPNCRVAREKLSTFLQCSMRERTTYRKLPVGSIAITASVPHNRGLSTIRLASLLRTVTS